MLTDSYDRTIDYLRISITNRCNFKCPYCRPRGEHEKTDELSIAELFEVCRLSIDNGIRKIRITGGEPCLRKDLPELITRIRDYDRSVEITLTTNGFNLKQSAESLVEAGLARINMSLDTLNKKRFAEITQVDCFEDVIAGIRKARELGLRVKINMVPLIGINDDEIMDMFMFCKKNRIMLRYIEFMENTSAKEGIKGLMGEEIAGRLRKTVSFSPYKEEYIGAASLYKTEDGYLFGIIESHTNDFCKKCNRVRMTSDGKIIPCLFYEDSVNVKEELRSGDLNAVNAKLLHAVKNKPEKNKWCDQQEKISGRAFYETGG